MGPNLTDAYWRYGGTPAAIYKSISEGRPQGMPSWGLALPSQEIWKIVAYIATLGGSYAPNLHDASLQGDHDVTSVAAIPASLRATGVAAPVPTPLAPSPLNNSTIPAAPTSGETTVTPQGPANSPPNTINQGSGTGQ